MKPLIETNRRAVSIAILLIRVMIGLIFFVGGAGKAMGWFGGFGMTATLQMLRTGLHIGTFWTYVSCYAEFIGGFLLIPGLLTRPAAFILTINMIVAVIVTGFANFFMGGAATAFLVMICCLSFVLSGPMIYSIDFWLAAGKRNTGAGKNMNFSL